uniref:Uncharacterized protein n=1 Tax=Cannabis sativa TaxID=3483 RepID=A0A803Q2Y0_CANSA
MKRRVNHLTRMRFSLRLWVKGWCGLKILLSRPPISLTYDLPAEAPVPTASASVSVELSGVRASLDALTGRVMTLKGLQYLVLDVFKALSKASEA